MGFKGSLDSINLADIFQNLSMNQQTGTLRLSDGDTTRSIYFQRGEVRYLAHGGRKSMLLGEMLTGRGIATHEQVGVALAEQKSSGRLLGEIIVDLGICTREEVDDLVRFQIEEEIYDLFSWERAEFEFTEGPPPEGLFDPEQQATELAMDTSRLIMEAARRIDEWERIRQVVPTMDEVYVATTSPELLPEGASPVAARILTYLDGTRSVEAVVEDSYFSRFEVASNLVEMIGAGQARPATVEELAAAAGLCTRQGMSDRAVVLMEKALAQGYDDPQLRQDLAEACIALGDEKKAAIHLNVLGDANRLQGDLDGAAAAYERITEVLPGGPAAHEKLARLRVQQGETERALGHYANLVQALMQAGRLDEAAASCREGLKADHENTDLRSALAKVLLSSGDKEGAIEEFERLAEIFARAGQVRPASEVFRRILQVDPRNRHAKRRLGQVLAGTGVKPRESHLLRNVLIGVVLALLSLGGYFVIHEMTVQTKFEEADGRSQGLEAEGRFDEARAVWRELEEEWSISLDFKAITAEKIDGIDTTERIRKRRREEVRRKASRAAERLFKEAVAHEKVYETTEFRTKISEFLTSEAASFGELKELKDEARELMSRVDIRERLISEYLEWLKKTAAATDVASLADERQRTLGIHSRYRHHPKLQSLTLPLLVETDPPGAKVLVGGTPRGTAPLVVRYPLGTTPAVRVEMPGYGTEEDIDARNRVRVMVKLRRAVAWQYNSGAPVLSLTGGLGGTVLLANQEGLLAALDPERGGADPATREAVWAFRTGDFAGIRSGVAVRGDTAYFATDRAYAFDLRGRRRRWVAEFGERGKVKILAPPTVGVVQLLGRELVFGTYNHPREGGTVWAAYNDSGEVRWEVAPSETCAGTRSRPLFRNDRLYVPFMDGRVYELEVVHGKTRHKWPVGSPSPFMSSIILEGGLAWLVSGDGCLYGLSLAVETTSKERLPRRFEAGRPITTDLTVAGGVGYFGDENGHLHAVDLRTLERVWRPPFAGEGKATAAPVVRLGKGADEGPNRGAGRVYFGTSAGWVYAIDREGGGLLWKYQVVEEVCCLHFTGRYLLAGARDGIVYAFDEEALR